MVIAYVQATAPAVSARVIGQTDPSIANHPDFDRGARLGIAEARHAATLLRRDLEVIELSADSRGSLSETLDSAGATVLVASSLTALLASRVGVWASRPGRAIVTSDAAFACRMPIFRTAPNADMRATAAAQAGDTLPQRRVPEIVGTVLTRKSVVLWHHDLERFGAAQLNDRYRQRYDRPMTSSAWEGWMAVKIAWESALRTRDGDVAAAIGAGAFDGHKGTPLRFGAHDRILRQPVFIVADTVDLRAGLPREPDDASSILVREIAWPTYATRADSVAAEQCR